MNFTAVKENLEKKGYKVSCFETATEGAAYLNAEIDGTTVGIGGSTTVREMGLLELLEAHNTVHWHNDPKQVAEFGAKAIRYKAMEAKIYIFSVNGLAATGEIINIDGSGNRLAGTLYGHDKIYFVVGVNKLEDTFDKAYWRARNIAAPKNAQRLQKKTPCAIKGDKCYNCNSPERICRGFLVMDRAMGESDMEVILINESLGY